MTKLLACAALSVGVVVSPATFAAEKTITLAVKNMHRADCPFIVKKWSAPQGLDRIRRQF